MVRSSDVTYVLAHAAKLGSAPFNAWVRVPSSWTLVTDEATTDVQIASFERRGVRVIVVDATGSEIVR